jgi:hypothetical protein
MPPAPTSDTISNAPRRAPGARDMLIGTAGLYAAYPMTARTRSSGVSPACPERYTLRRFYATFINQGPTFTL